MVSTIENIDNSMLSLGKINVVADTSAMSEAIFNHLEVAVRG